MAFSWFWTERRSAKAQYVGQIVGFAYQALAGMKDRRLEGCGSVWVRDYGWSRTNPASCTVNGPPGGQDWGLIGECWKRGERPKRVKSSIL